MSSNVLEMQGIEKSFNGIPVLKGANFSLRHGEVHALMGGNGAGKSTLMKILTGVYSKGAGTVLLNGNPVEFTEPRDAEKHGIAMIFQELSLVPTLTVAQNIYLNHEPPAAGGLFINDMAAVRGARQILSELEEDIDPRTPVEALSVGRSQMVEIAKALSKKAKILIMDEPTSSISEHETQALFKLINKLKRSGISIIYISHRMSEIFTICDRVTVMRDGTCILTDECKNVTMQALVNSMLGSDTGASFHWKPRNHEIAGRSALEVRDVIIDEEAGPISFSIQPGEIVGIAGLMGSGRTEIAEAIFGLRPSSGGEILVHGKPVRGTSQAIEAGIALVPENRRTQGLILDHTLRDNFMLPSLMKFTRGLFVRDSLADKSAGEFVRKLKIKTDGTGKVVRLLSGGNQQKIVLAKWLERNPAVLILDEPTIGVDIGAKSDIVDIVRSLASRGTAVLVISSEFEELLAMSDRVIVIHDGRIVSEFDRQEIESEEVLHHAVQA
jgi:ribose transport system ATP-binding protein